MKRYIVMILAIGQLAMGNWLWAMNNEQSNKEAHWRTYFAYNSVQVIAMDAQEEVYAVANGKLFSINPVSEKLTLYNNFSGMHGTEIAHIAYDQARKQMLIMYMDGKMDIWHANKQMQYISDLYNKQMTASKKCNNITIHGHMAYLSMDFGILTFDLEQYELVDAFYIGPEASDVIVSDVMIQGDSIYAKTRDYVYAAHMKDNIVDYRYWTSRAVTTVVFDSKKGREYTSSNGDVWAVAGAKGVERRMVTKEKVYYLPDGPEVNTPYGLTWSSGRLWMVQGGRWVNQNKTPGHVMIFDNGKWKNITNSVLQAAINQKSVLDLTGIAVDKDDATHFWVSSYGTGLYEFKEDVLVNRYTADNSIMGSAAANTDRYTRVENPVYDNEGVLWVSVAGGVDTTLVAFLPDGSQRGVNFYTEENERFVLSTPGGLLIDHKNPDRKWAISCRAEPGVVLLDDGGTRYDGRDDKCVVRKEFHDQDGQLIVPEYFYGVSQGPDGSVWIASSSGPIIIPQEIDMMQTNECKRLRIEMADGSYLLETDRVNAFAWDSDNRLWIGSQAGGVFVLDADYDELVACYTTSNSVMPTNTVLSLAWDEDKQQMYIGTSGGLVSYTDNPDIYSSVSYDEQEETSEYSYGSMYKWRAHNAFTYVKDVVSLGDKVYGLSAESLFSVDKETELVSNVTKLDGLSASGINQIAKNETLNRIIITYQDGEIDIIDAEGNIYPIMDLYLKQMSGSKVVNDICVYKEKAYLAMSWGILVVNMQKAEIEDTYYIGNESSEVDVKYICTVNEKVYAMTDGGLYCAHMRDNLVDYAYWNIIERPAGKTVSGMRELSGILFLVIDSQLWKLQNDTWVQIPLRKLRGLYKTGDNLWLLPVKNSVGINGIGKLPKSGAIEWIVEDMVCHCIVEDGNQYWIGAEDNGLVKYNIATMTRESKYPDGPSSNYSYWIRFVGDRLYMLPGGRWANEFKRKGDVMIFENEEWHNIKNADLLKMTGGHKVLDLMNVAQDPRDAKHYWVTSYGTGLYEFYDNQLKQIYLPDNSNLISAAPINPAGYTRTDGAMYDEQGNLWVLNLGGGETKNIHVINPDGIWHSFNIIHNRKPLEMHTAGEMLIDKRNPAWKWIPLLRYNTGLVLLDDNGTPTQSSDDKMIYRTDWKDQNGNTIAPTTIHALAQDQNNVLWIGTGSGILAIPPTVDFMKSNRCVRVIIPRNDGTQLGDYLLDNEQVNAIKVDGANRLWVGTANSGIFLLKPVTENVEDPSYYVETVSHFTTENSILPSNEIMSIDIKESTGEVFIATGGGLVSYMSDATKGRANYSEIYAYPNPVAPTYRGYITFKGLMDKTELRIVDGAGNLVKTIHSEGGTATWDAKNTRGERVSSGVYTAICNTSDGQHSGTVKVLILH